ncbi:hypothetical protein OG937_10970 [Streptomyces sp. NBC_00510]
MLPIIQVLRIGPDGVRQVEPQESQFDPVAPHPWNGMVRLSLSWTLEPIQVWKLVIPGGRVHPDPQAHEGHMRELLVKLGEAAEFSRRHHTGPATSSGNQLRSFVCNGFDRAVGQQIDCAAGLDGNEDRRLDVALAQGELVDAQDTRHRGRRMRQGTVSAAEAWNASPGSGPGRLTGP